MRVRVIAASAVIGLIAATVGCSGSSDDASSSSSTAATVLADTTGTPIEAHGGTGQVWLKVAPGTEVELVGPRGEPVDTQQMSAKGDVVKVAARKADANGAVVFRFVKPGKGYVVRPVGDDNDLAQSRPVDVTAKDEHPDASFYEGQELEPGFGYMTARDGTKLSVNVKLPGPPEKGPYPTVIEYSGYEPSNPNTGLTSVSSIVAGAMGFATVGVNIRGSGCSGGSFMLWEDPQATDGYDAVETVAAQPWVKGGKVGMVGLSYPATALLYAAALRPPHLAAIAPMASYDDGFRALLWPGGIQNEGFARAWVNERDEEAKPAAADWAETRIKEGDETCKANMDLRGQNVALSDVIDARPFYPTDFALGDTFAPASFVDQIEVPTYMVAAWQDEQVGGHAPSMIEHLPEDHTWVTLVNGNHTEGLAVTSVIQRWLEFLQIYVAGQVPDTKALAALYPVVASQILEAPADKVAFPAEEFAAGTTLAEAKATFESRPRVRVLLDNGGAPGVDPGLPTAAFEEGFDTFPVPGVKPTRMYLGPDGTLVDEAPAAADDTTGTIDEYVADPSARPKDNLPEGSTWAKLPKYVWTPVVDGKSLSYASAPLAEDTVMIGTASADLWMRSSEPDTDVQVTLTEIRPDGKETFVQSGRLRASKRKLDKDESSVLQPVPSMLEEDAEPMPKGEFVPMRVEIYPFGHAFRAGSRVRITVTAPGGDMPEWTFVTLPGTQDNAVARSKSRPSSIALPVVPGIAVPDPLPACPALRGQPCRDYVEPGPQG